jgi:hypothetical protein
MGAVTPEPDHASPCRHDKCQRDLTSLLGVALLMAILAIVVWALTGAGSFWPVWVIAIAAVAVTAAAVRAAAARPPRAAHPSPGGRGA